MDIIQQMIAAKIARNPFHAAAIANGLQLAGLATDEERMERARLYRLWRDAGEPPRVAFRNAIDGREPMALPGPESGARGALQPHSTQPRTNDVGAISENE